MKPILKWVGGKRKLLKTLSLYVPKKHSNYIEPFTGGGTMFFDVNSNGSIINDANGELINFYRQIKDNPLELLEAVKKLEISEESYYNIREWDRGSDWKDKKSCLQRAVRFLYLNKTAFNGMWRVNSKGEVNIPYGFYTDVTWPKEGHVLNVSNLLRKTVILNGDFSDTIHYVHEDTFVYLDPPYIPYSDTANFTDYTIGGFDLKDQERLVEFCKKINELGGKFLLSNSDTPITRQLYKDFEINPISVYHSVGASAKSRKDKGEVLVRNYKGNCRGLFL